MGNEIKRIRIRVVPRSKIDFVSKRMCNFKSISSETEFFFAKTRRKILSSSKDSDFAPQNKEENPLLAIGLGFCSAKQGGKSSPRQRIRILLRKTRRIICQNFTITKSLRKNGRKSGMTIRLLLRQTTTANQNIMHW